MIVIPAIDLINGRVVRLSQGDYAQQTDYPADPVELAREFEKSGFTHLHVVDLDGARSGKPMNVPTVQAICKSTGLHVDTGGGIQTEEDVLQYLECGVRQLNIGSLAVKDPERFSGWIRKFGPEAFILSADVRDGRVAVRGWLENSGMTVEELIASYLPMGLKRVTCTDIRRDGMLSGPSTELYISLMEKFPEIELTASGGISSVGDLVELKKTGCHSAITGKALLQGLLPAEELQTNGLL